VLATVAGEVAVMAIDHGQARAHVAGELEGGDAGTQGEGRERVPEIVDPPERLDPNRLLRGLPVAVAEVVTTRILAPFTVRTPTGCTRGSASETYTRKRSELTRVRRGHRAPARGSSIGEVRN